MASPPRPPVRKTSRHGMISTPQVYMGDADRDIGHDSLKKNVVFSRSEKSLGGASSIGPHTKPTGTKLSSSESQDLPAQAIFANGSSPPPNVVLPPRGDSRTHALEQQGGSVSGGTMNNALGKGTGQRYHSSSAGQDIFERISQFVDFDSRVYDENCSNLENCRSIEEPMLKVKMQRMSPDTPSDPSRPGQSRWALLKSEDRAIALLAMTPFARSDVYRNEMREIVTQAICAAFSREPGSNPTLLMELDPEGRADVLSYLTISQRAVAVAGMLHEDRMKTLHHMPPEHVGPSLANLSPAEVLKTFKALDTAKRPVVFADLDGSARTAVLAWTPSKSRIDLLIRLRAADRATALLSLPLKECCSTIRSMSSFHAECVLLEMNADSRSQVLSSIPERDLSGLLLGMPIDGQLNVLDGLTPQALHHAFRCIPSAAQAILFDDLSIEECAGVVSRMSPKERMALVSSLPSGLQANLLRLLDPKDAATTLRGLDKEDTVGALGEMNSVEQAEIIKCMSGKDRAAVLSRMEPYERAAIISEIQLKDRMAFLRGMNVQDLANTMSEMTPEENLHALSSMTSNERAEVFSAMNPKEREELALLMKPELLASALAEMSPDDRKVLVNALPADEKALVLCSMPEGVRALVVKSIMPDQAGTSNAMRQGRDSEFLDTLRNMGSDAVLATLDEMSQRDKVTLALLLPVRERARVLERMNPLECADILDCFLLEDRANTVSSFSPSHAAIVLTEMHAYKRAIVLAAVGERDRLAIMQAMTAQDVGTVLSVLPPADCVATLRTLDTRRAAEALAHLVPEERAITMEAIGAKDRMAILSHMETDQAAYLLSRLTAEECAATLRLFEDDIMASILQDIPSKIRSSALLACPVKFRVHAVSMLQTPELSSFLEGLDHMDLTTTSKLLAQSVLGPVIPGLSLDCKVKVLGCIAPQEAASVLQQLPPRVGGEVLERLPIESCAALLKYMDDDSIYATSTNMDRREREKMLSGLPETLQLRISKITLPSQPSPAAAHRHSNISHSTANETARQPDPGGSIPHVIPVRRPSSLSPPVSPSKRDHDVAVTISMKFDEDYDWLTSEEQRKSSWAEWLRGIVCRAVRASPRRIEFAGLQRGSVCLLLRCLPASGPLGVADADNRTAMELALQILAFSCEKDVATKLPKFLGGHLHTLGDTPSQEPAQVLAQPLSTCVQSSRSPASVGPSANGEASYIATKENCGVGIAFAPTADGKHLSVIGMIPGGDADRSGLIHVGDIVSSIDGSQVKDIPVPKLAQRIRGPVGSRIQVGFKSQQGASEKKLDLQRIPAASSSSPSPMRLSSSSSSGAGSWNAAGMMPVQLSFLSDHTADASVKEQHQDWHLEAVPDGTAAIVKADQGAPDKSPGEGRVLRAMSAPAAKLRLGTPLGMHIGTLQHVHRSSSDAVLGEASPAKHDIWGTLEQLDASIQRRNADVRTFTESLLKLQAESTSSPEIVPVSAKEHVLSDFFYA